jgi:hypothetical protein
MFKPHKLQCKTTPGVAFSAIGFYSQPNPMSCMAFAVTWPLTLMQHPLSHMAFTGSDHYLVHKQARKANIKCMHNREHHCVKCTLQLYACVCWSGLASSSMPGNPGWPTCRLLLGWRCDQGSRPQKGSYLVSLLAVRAVDLYWVSAVWISSLILLWVSSSLLLLLMISSILFSSSSIWVCDLLSSSK